LIASPLIAASFAMVTYVVLIFIAEVIQLKEIRQMVKVLAYGDY